MLQSQIMMQSHQPTNASQLPGNKVSNFIEQLRISLQRPYVWEKCRDLNKLLSCVLSLPSSGQM